MQFCEIKKYSNSLSGEKRRGPLIFGLMLGTYMFIIDQNSPYVGRRLLCKIV
jgi:hypothetical protein